MMASPLSGVVNGPISGALLEYTNKAWGLAGWQWLFLLEGIPAVILGFVTWWFLTDRPEEAGWLEPGERAWLAARMAREERGREALHGLNRLRALGNPRFGLLILLYFTIAVGTNGYGFFAPTIIDTHFPNRGADQIGLLYAIPSLVAAIGMLLFSRHSDRSGERRWHLAVAAFVAAIGWALSATLQSPWLVLAGAHDRVPGNDVHDGPILVACDLIPERHRGSGRDRPHQHDRQRRRVSCRPTSWAG